MGMFRKVHSKFKNFYDIREEFKETGISEEEIAEYDFLYEAYEKGVKDSDRLNKAEEKADSKVEREDKKIEYLEEKMAKMREKAGPLARLKFSKIASIFSKDARKYRNLKKRLKRAKARRKVAENTLKVLQAKIKVKEKELKVQRKDLKVCEKNIRKIWQESKDEIKTVKQTIRDEERLANQEEIKKRIEAIQKDDEDIELEEIKKAIKKVQKKEEEAKKEEKSSKKKEQKEEQQDKKEKPKKKKIQDELKEGIVFGSNTTVDKTIIEDIQKRIVEDEKTDPALAKAMKGLTPEEFMAWYGYLENIKNNDEKDPYSMAMEEMKKAGEITMAGKRGLKSFEKYLENDEEIDESKLGKVDRSLYEFAKLYRDQEAIRSEKEKGKEQVKEDEEMQIG